MTSRAFAGILAVLAALSVTGCGPKATTTSAPAAPKVATMAAGSPPCSCTCTDLTCTCACTCDTGTPPAAGAPAAASNLTATNQPSAATPSIKLDWKDNSTNETGFKVLRQPSGAPNDPYTLVHTTAAGVVTYTDAGLTNYWEYNYEIVATNATGDAPHSNIVKAQALLTTGSTGGGPPPTGGISVKDHGAKGDGVTDDKAAIQNAINACASGGAVKFPAGTYKVSGTLSLKASCTYYGEGNPKLVGYTGTGAGGYYLASTAGSHIKIQGIIFDGGGVTLPVEMQSHITITGNKFQNILNSNTAFGSAWAGVWIGGTLQDSSISGNTFSNILDGGNANITDGQLGAIRGYRLSRVTISDNIVDRVQQGFSVSQSQEAEYTLPSYDDVHIERNKFTNLRRMAIEIQAHRLLRWVLADNTGTWMGNPFWNSMGISFAADGDKAVIRHNIFDQRGKTGETSYCLEGGGGTNALYEANECKSDRNFKYGIVMAWAPYAQVKNNLFCGKFTYAPTGYEPPHIDQQGKPATFTNNQTPDVCP